MAFKSQMWKIIINYKKFPEIFFSLSSQKYWRMITDSYFISSIYSQIWWNLHRDDCHFSCITKFLWKTLEPKCIILKCEHWGPGNSQCPKGIPLRPWELPSPLGTLGTTLSQVLCTLGIIKKTTESSSPYWLGIIFRSEVLGTRVSFFPILWCSWTGNLPSDDLARFGYILDMNVEKNHNPSIFLATYWNLA